MGSESVKADDPMLLNAVGFVRSDYHHYDKVPHRHGGRGWTAGSSEIELLPQHAAKLGGLDGYSHLIVVYWIHRAREWRMPKDHAKPPQVKLFATRMPKRPNPIGLSVVELVSFSREEGKLEVRGLDALDETPVLDIKPYIPYFDSYQEATVPDWLTEHIERFHEHHDHDH